VTDALSSGIGVLSGRRDKPIPPKELHFVGGGDFRKIGANFLGYFVELGGLKPHHHVLDIGSGIGRMAIPLTRFLDESGRYDGFDIVPAGVDWCRDNVAARHPNFRFELADVYNEFYRPDGTCRASEYKFPYGDEIFDFVIAVSVFTHMLPGDMANYLSETVRVLRRGSRCFTTFFLLNEESRRLLRAGASTLDFQHEGDGYYTANLDVPEALVAYDEEAIRAAYERRGLSIVDPIRYGSWCEREDPLSFQDIVVATKR
jgi:SAM-dependent methyltransferase